MFHIHDVHADNIYFSKVAEFQFWGNACLLVNRICSPCDLSIFNSNYFPFWFRGYDIGSDCASSWSLLILYF